MIVVASPERDAFAIERHTAPILGPDQLAIWFDPFSQPSRWLDAWRSRGERMPAAVYLGGDPTAMLLDDLPLGDCDQPYTMAGVLGDRPLEIVPCRTHGLPVPAGAEIVIEGFIDPEAPCCALAAVAAPNGYYAPWPVARRLQVMAVTQRATQSFPR